jgi:EmrB/QacA subfamily drug resistance transporter
MYRRRWWALGALAICLLTLGLDGTILNVALPTLATHINASTSSLQWIIDSYVLVFAGLLLPFGAIGDRLGRRRVLLMGLACFGLASIAAAWTTDTGGLIAARAVMGLGSAIMTPMAMAIVPVIFPAEQLGRAIGVIAAAMGLGVPLGPIAGGYLLDHFWWGSVFLVNVPVAALGMAAAVVFIPESRSPEPKPADLVGGALSVAGLVTLVYGIIESPRYGWGQTRVLVPVAAGAVLLAVFVVRESRYRYPMIDLGLFRRPRFLWGTVAATISTFAMFGLLFTLPQLLQAVQGYDAFGTGLRLVPMMGGLILGAGAADRIVARVGSKVPVAVGLAVIAVGLAVGATQTRSTPYGFTATWLAIVGLGIGLVLPPATEAVLGELPTQHSGAGTSLMMTLRQVAAALGVALLGSLLSHTYTDQLDVTGLPPSLAETARDSVGGAMALAGRLPSAALADSAAQAYLHAMSAVLLVCAGLMLIGAVLVAIALPARHRSPSAPDTSPGAPRETATITT